MTTVTRLASIRTTIIMMQMVQHEKGMMATKIVIVDSDVQIYSNKHNDDIAIRINSSIDISFVS